jgi:UDP-N-acetylmuramoyl-L-alanyl-D-glutamate--2,6-diaminopimelate ligase
MGDASPPKTVTAVAVVPSQVRPGSVFVKCAWPTLRTTAAEGVRSGASHIVLQEGDPEQATLPPEVSRTVVRDVNRAYAVMCANFTGNAHHKLKLIAVTGTKGKTTTCHLVDDALRHAGIETALCSSLALRLPRAVRASVNTTPEPLLLHSFLAEASRQGASHATIEVSSIAIAEERIHGLRFDALGFTNLGSDHLEYHGGRERYADVKRRLFCDPSFHASPSTLCAINGDDPVGRELARSTLGRVQTFGLHTGELTPSAYSCDESGIWMRIEGRELHLPLLGEHNLSNALAAITLTAGILGSVPAAIDAMVGAKPVPGRLERMETTLDVQVYVDYAHTPESVEAVLDTIAAIAGNRRRVAVVGCSGNSDRQKRPRIARAAAAGSDICILTSDNPNHEHPASIIRDMIAGLRPSEQRAELHTIIDRRAAITKAIELALPNGVVVLLGKGTERFQLIEGRRVPHSDRAVAGSILSQLESV